MRRVFATSIMVLLCSTAWADALGDRVKARELGQIVGTAEICGYKLDEQKTVDYVSTFLESADGNARNSYETGSGAHKLRLGELSEVERKVACATQAKLAAKYGLTQ